MATARSSKLGVRKEKSGVDLRARPILLRPVTIVDQCLVTVRVTVAVFTSEPLVPFTVSVKVPVGVLVVVRTVRVELPEPLTEVGLNEPVEFEGKPLTLNVTTPLNPSDGVTVAV